MRQTVPRVFSILKSLPLFAFAFLLVGAQPAHADLSSLISELQKCQRSENQLRQCQREKTALAAQGQGKLRLLRQKIQKQNKLIAQYRKRLGIKAPKVNLGKLAAHPAASANRVLVVGNANDAASGNSNAAVTIYEFSDFQCPYCSRGAKIMDQVKKAFKGQVRLVFKHSPLSFHKQAHIAAQASLAAKAQGKFWQMHDKLFANQRNISKANLLKWAKELGLDVAKFKSALDNGTYKAQVNRDLKYAPSVGARGTPSFFINGRKISGAQPFPRFQQIIKQELDLIQKLKQAGVTSDQMMKQLLAFGKVARQARINLLKNIPIQGSPISGPSTAKVTIYEFSDFQCPYCSRGSKVIAQVKKAYGNKVRVVFKHNPLSFHKQAHIAAQASMAANAQGKFWPYHDKLFANQRNLSKANLIKWAKELGLDVALFTKELNSGKYKEKVNQDMALGRRVGVRGTPNFYINGQKIAGAYPFSHFQKIINPLLGRKNAPIKRAAPSIIKRPTRPKPSAKANPNAAKSAVRTYIKINPNDASFGPKNALITIVEFSDFQCPFCSRGTKVMNQVKKAFKGQVRIVFKHLPLPFHNRANIAAQASLAAKAQGKFWPYHDKLFANQRNMSKENLVKWAKELGLDVAKFKAALDNGTHKAQVNRDLQYSRTVGARGTPNFFVNGRKVSGAYPFNHFQKIIKQDLALIQKWLKAGVSRDKIYAKFMESGKKAAEALRLKKLRAALLQRRALKTLNLNDAGSFGPKTAKVTIIEFSDFQCPYCSRGAKIIAQIKKAYGNKVRVVFKNLPLSFHKQAYIAAQASLAAKAQGKFWQMHDKLFANQRNLNKANLIKWAKELGLDVTKFKIALNKGTHKAQVDRDLADARRLGVRGTPNFFINGRKLVGAQPFPRFKAIIEQELRK